MAIYGTGVTLLINMLIYIFATSTESQIGVLAYADDFSVAGKLGDLRNWWQTFLIGPKFGYYTEPTKTWLAVKPYASQWTTKIFSGGKIKITNEGHRHLGEKVET